LLPLRTALGSWLLAAGCWLLALAILFDEWGWEPLQRLLARARASWAWRVARVIKRRWRQR